MYRLRCEVSQNGKSFIGSLIAPTLELPEVLEAALVKYSGMILSIWVPDEADLNPTISDHHLFPVVETVETQGDEF